MKRSAPNSLQIFDSPSKKMTEGTAGEKEWKWKHYFSQVPSDIRSSIEMDETALFSVTVDTDADVITRHLSTIIPMYAKICDATACVGGNTMSFAKYFTDVTSVEMDRGRYEMLNNNIKLMKLQDRVHTANRDFLEFKDKMPYFDFIFFDPPWGGENYQEKSNIDMYMSDRSIGDIVYSLRNKCRYVGLKSPQNFNLPDFEKQIKANRIWYNTFDISRRKGTYWVFTLYEFCEEGYGGILHMLSPALSPSILTHICTNHTTAIQSPSYQESEYITNQIKERMKSIDCLFDMSASIGIQSLSFISNHISNCYTLLSSQMQVLESNVQSFISSLQSRPHQLHFIYESDHGALKGDVVDIRRIMSQTSNCIYLDLYNELSVDQLKNLHQAHMAIDKQPIEVVIQQFTEISLWTQFPCFLVIRLPEALVSLIEPSLRCFSVDRLDYKQSTITSSLCLPHTTSLLFISPYYPKYTSYNQLNTLWLTQPPCLLRKQLNSIFTTVLSDRETVMTVFQQYLINQTFKDDKSVWNAIHKAYLSSFQLSPTSHIDRTMAIKVDRSIVRVYANKMKYIDGVVPRGFRPHRILCVGGVDAHLAHDVAKMYSLTAKDVLLFGEDDRRKEEKRTDYQFIPYPAKLDDMTWSTYQSEVIQTLESHLGDDDIDMLIVCCAHEVPFFGSILSTTIHHLSNDGVIVLNDHDVSCQREQVLLEIVHDFHRYVTCCHISPLLDRQSLRKDSTIDKDNKCEYCTSNEWEQRLKEYGLSRVVNQRSAALWNTSDHTNLLKSFWGCFTYLGMKN